MLSFKNYSNINESSSEDVKDLLHHVTKYTPSTSNILKMHDKIRSISKKHGIPTDELYGRVVKNPWVHQKYKDAATL